MTQDSALDILKTGASVFLTGEPGTGKTFTINRYVAYLKSCGIEPAVVASTGIAATHIGGRTIHSWSGIGIASSLSPMDLDRITSAEPLHKRISKPSVLIIDEVSMLGAHVLDMVDQVCREVRRNNVPFGGLQTILVGDFFQLPPVSRRGQNIQYAFASPAWQELDPVVCYLDEQYRQDDSEFLTLLSAIRGNGIDEEHVGILQQRIESASEAPEKVTKLYSHNADVDKMNDAHLTKLEGDFRLFTMRKKGKKHLAESLSRGCLSPEELKLKIGAAVMFTRNSPQDGYANGTTGTVEGFDTDTGEPQVRIKSGKLITVSEEEWSIDENGKPVATIIQLPLRLAWAMTIHKSQGMSMDAALMDLSQTFEYGQGYVALSRVRSLSGVYLLGCNRRALEVHPEILEQDRRFRDAALGAEKAVGSEDAESVAKLHAEFIEAAGGHPPKEKKPSRLDEIRKSHPKAGRKWTTEEEDILKRMFENENSMKEITEAMGRRRGGIHARLVKIGLIEE